jgi:hypothetical protein
MIIPGIVGSLLVPAVGWAFIAWAPAGEACKPVAD